MSTPTFLSGRPRLDQPIRMFTLRSASPWPDEAFTSSAGGTLVLQCKDGGRFSLDRSRWHDEPSPADIALLERSRGPVLDVGCGPGRLVHALVRSGRVALGIDTSAAAVDTARRRGAPVAHTSVFGTVPLAGMWGTALLLDGNIGIGGDVRTLLRRTLRLIDPAGLILVEVESPSSTSANLKVRVEREGGVGRWFPWSRVAASDLGGLAQSAGLRLDDLWQHSGRWFAQLAPANVMEKEAAW